MVWVLSVPFALIECERGFVEYPAVISTPYLFVIIWVIFFVGPEQ